MNEKEIKEVIIPADNSPTWDELNAIFLSNLR